MKRAKDIMVGVLEGRYEHNDLAMYHLHIAAVRQHKKALLKKPDLADVRDRLSIMFPETKENVPTLTVDALPRHMKEFVQDRQVKEYKIEWMYNGVTHEELSEGYKRKFGYNRFGYKKLYCKLIDTLGMSRWEVPFKMWIESLFRLGQVIRYEGMSYHTDTEMTTPQVVKMMSHVVDFNHIISITVVV
jgi:hypothetical protein